MKFYTEQEMHGTTADYFVSVTAENGCLVGDVHKLLAVHDLKAEIAEEFDINADDVEICDSYGEPIEG